MARPWTSRKRNGRTLSKTQILCSAAGFTNGQLWGPAFEVGPGNEPRLKYHCSSTDLERNSGNDNVIKSCTGLCQRVGTTPSMWAASVQLTYYLSTYAITMYYTDSNKDGPFKDKSSSHDTCKMHATNETLIFKLEEYVACFSG